MNSLIALKETLLDDCGFKDWFILFACVWSHAKETFMPFERANETSGKAAHKPCYVCWRVDFSLEASCVQVLQNRLFKLLVAFILLLVTY